jgi:hypothetical protein
VPVVAELAKTISGVTSKKVWKFEVVVEDDVPKAFWRISESAIGDAVRGGVHNIPGVRIYQEDVLAVRA